MELEDRVAASQTLVAAFRGAPGFAEISSSEAESLSELLANATVTVQKATQLITAIQAIGLVRADEVSLLKLIQMKLKEGKVKPPRQGGDFALAQPSAMTPDATPPPGAPAESALYGLAPPVGMGKIQNYESIPLYYTAEVRLMYD